jgi:DNA-dependent RNA polymerase auxiliary subunit epsilon
LQQHRQHLSELCLEAQKAKNNTHNAEFTVKIGEYVIDRSYAMEFISKRSDAHHFKLSKWTDIKFSIHL